MANVVGILVVLMAVTQLTVNDAMKRIKVWESEESVSVREEQEEARVRLASLGPADLARNLELARLREHIRTLRESDVATDADSAAVSARVASQRLRIRKLEERVAEKREKLANLKILLAESQGRFEEEGISLRLPDPRPPPVASEPVAMLCRYGRVFDPRFETLEHQLLEVVRRQRNLSRYLDAYDVGNELLRWRVVDTTGGALAQLEWRDTEIGETLAELRSPTAAYHRVLAERDPKTEFLHFVVWEDSFEVYLEARRLAEEKGYAVGWLVVPNGRPLSVGQDRASPTPVD